MGEEIGGTEETTTTTDWSKTNKIVINNKHILFSYLSELHPTIL